MAVVNGSDTGQDQNERIAAAALDRLLGGATGLTLVGAQARIDRIIPRLHNRLDRCQLLPVVFPADHGTPESLRAAIEQAHADRSGSMTAMLLIVPDAGRLSADLLRELDMAADAAAEFGGLKFMLASTGPLRGLLREAGLASLHDVLGADLVVPSSEPRTRTPRSAAAIRQRRPIHPVQRILLAAGILAGFILVVALVLAAIRPGRQAIPMAAPPATHAPPPASGMPVLPVQPVQPPVRTTPSPGAPSEPAPSQAAPSRPTPSREAPSRPAPFQPAPAAPPPVAAPPASASLLLMAQPGDTLPVLYARVYAGSNPPPFAQVEALNPIVRPGARLVFPPPPGGWPPKP